MPADGAYAGVFARAAGSAAELEASAAAARHRAAEAFAALLSLAGEARLRAIEEAPAAQGWALVDLLRDRSWDSGPEDPARSLELARLATALAERVAPGAESAALRADLRALASAQLGNAERVAGDLRAAESALRTARERLAEGTGDSLVRGRVLSLLASLRNDQSRFDEAVEAAARAARCYRRAGDDHGYGRTLIKLATFHAYRDELDLACRRLDEAMAHLDPAAEPRLLFAARANRAAYLERAGRLEEAATELKLAAPLAQATFDRVRLGWLSGRLALRRGDDAAGERSLLEAREAFLAEGLAYETAQVSLELAALYAVQGRTADQRRLAEEMVPLFVARDLHPEARAALALYCDAARAEAVSARLAREVADYLDRAHGRPTIPFRSGRG